MRFDMLTLFPAMMEAYFDDSIMARAVEGGLLEVHYTNYRDYSTDKHHHVDDSPFGGGAGMVLKPEPLFAAVRDVAAASAVPAERRHILLMAPAGAVFTQKKAKELATYDQLIFICGHYEGYDARITDYLADEALSIGDYVLTGGELPAMVIADAVARMIPRVLGAADSAATDSFYAGLLEYPQYTRPREFEGHEVPEVLLSGDHQRIARWRRQQQLERTLARRPDLLASAPLTDEDRRYLDRLKK